MKKLLLLILMTLLSATAVDAALVYLRFSSTQGGSGVSGTLTGQLPQGSISTTWVYTCKGSALSSYVSNNGFYIRPRVDYDGVDDYYNTSDEAAVNITNGGAAHTFYRWNDNQTNGYFGHVSGLPADYADYDFTFTVSYTDKSGQASLSVSWEKPSNIQLKSTIDSWHGTNYDSYENGVYTWTWNKTQLSGISAGSDIDFQLYDPDTGYWYGMSSRTSLGNNTWSTSTANGTSNTQNWYTTHQKGYTYTIQAQKSGSTWQIKYIRNEEDHDYYWVSPEITNGQKWEYFKMVPSRNRSGDYGDGKTSDKYFSFTIKDDDLRNWDGTTLSTGTKIRWYVVRDDDAKWFRPTSNVDKGTTYDGNYTCPNASDITDFSFNNFENIGTTTNRETYISFSKGARKSYTFILNAKPSSGTGNLYVDSPIDGVGNTGIDYYLIGNFNSASETERINISEGKKMDKIVYADSVVYQITVSRPDGGWGNLYLDINPSDNTNNEWKYVYRPLISLYNNLDGRALVGGLTKSGYGDHNGVHGDQSLNPEPSDFYSGYTFRFNATTMTYQLEFHTSLYLVGDGVTAKDDNNNTLGGNWDISNSNNLIPLKATQDPKHFRNTVTFVNGAVSGTDNTDKGFRFLLTEDENTTPTYKINWGENSNVPRWLSLDESANHFDGPDTQYKNYLLYTENGANSSTSPSGQGSNVIFDLADGEYVINFYNYASPYYTIERNGEMRDYNEVIYKGNTRNILGRNDYKFFCVWSDYIAWNKPDDVDVYTVTQFNPSGSHAATVTLAKQDISYIPAKKAVILAMKTDKDKLKGGMVYDAVKPADLKNNTGFNKVIMDMTPYATPDATVSSGVPEFKPLYESTELSRYEGTGDSQKANYLFGFYHANHVVAGNTYDNADFLLGFWQTTGNGSTYPNSGFLQLTRAQADKLGVGAAYTITDGGAGAPAFLLLFDDEDATVTGIRDLDAEVPSVKDSADDHWYTLSGVRIAQPTAKGIYIHGGKKVIVR